MNALSYVVLGIIALGVFFALRAMRTQKSSCSGHCGGCTVDCKHKHTV